MINKLAFLLLIPFLFIQCNDKIVDPQPKAEGYQENISWQSLADSPWPMYQNNPQRTGRSIVSLNIAGMIDNQLNNYWGSLWGSVGVDSDTNIYVPVFFAGTSLKIFNRSGEKSDSLAAGDSYICPVILSGNSFYHVTTGGVSLFNENKQEAWKIDILIPESTVESAVNVDKEGNIYFAAGKTLYSVSRTGNINWTYNASDDIWNLTFSPDGKTLYYSTEASPLNALNIETRSLKWSFGTGAGYWLMVNSQGQIYCSASEINGQNSGGVSCIMPDGTLRWSYGDNGHKFTDTPTLDRNGNIYFLYAGTIYSLDYTGALRWKKDFADAAISRSALISDDGGNIYFAYRTPSELLFQSLNSDGNTKFVLPLGDGISGNPVIGFDRVYLVSWKTPPIFIIK